MKTFLRFVLFFLAVTGGVALATGVLDIEFGNSYYWERHGVLFLLFIMLFPRLTLLLSSVATGGWLWWLAWFLAPRLLVAVLATLAYWHQHPFLVVVAWLIAFSGESSEKYVVTRRSQKQWGKARGYDSAQWVDSEPGDRR